MSNNSLGDRMKEYEGHDSKRFLPFLPIIARLDGKGFHNFTRDLDKPYDVGLVSTFRDLTQWLVEETNATVGYCQSDEISLIYHTDNIESQVFFDGKRDKIISVLASMCTLKFNSLFMHSKGALFDCRAFQVPNKSEACNYLVWRELDATRNSIQMAARAYFSHKECINKNCNELQEMLFSQKQINWNDYPDFFKKGSYYNKRRYYRPLKDEELLKIPEEHRPAKTDLVLKTDIEELRLPVITKVENIVDVIFHEKVPILKSR